MADFFIPQFTDWDNSIFSDLLALFEKPATLIPYNNWINFEFTPKSPLFIKNRCPMKYFILLLTVLISLNSFAQKTSKSTTEPPAVTSPPSEEISVEEVPETPVEVVEEPLTEEDFNLNLELEDDSAPSMVDLSEETPLLPTLFDEETKQYHRELTRLKYQNALELEKIRHQLEKLRLENEQLELDNTLFEQQQQKLLAKMTADKNRISLENDLREQLVRREELKDSLKNFQRTSYLEEPLVNDKLIISDRRIVLDEVISSTTADFVTQSIHFYNNENSQYPIFLIIEKCAGGSVVEGARILQAMKHSTAPVYVVVKSLAASMAAVITAHAKRSFAHPNALIIHHQMANMFFGNVTEVDQSLQFVREWTNRLLTPVAKKMNLTLEQFIEEIYKHNIEGEWVEFADEAQKLGWVETIVEGIQESAHIRLPSLESTEVEEEEQSSEEEKSTTFLQLRKNNFAHNKFSSQATEQKKMTTVQSQLPPLVAGDFYYLSDLSRLPQTGNP